MLALSLCTMDVLQEGFPLNTSIFVNVVANVSI